MIPRMTLYERAVVIGNRASQIANGSPIAIKTDKTDPVEIAREELHARKINLIIRRPNANGSYVDIQVKDMIV